VYWQVGAAWRCGEGCRRDRPGLADASAAHRGGELALGCGGRDFLAQASSADIVHLECHGSWQPTVTSADPLDASFLELADRLPAREVADNPGALHASLVFLNACLSGTFTPGLRNEAGGFWQAFLIGGTSSLLATLTIVDPRMASELVAGFY
jgi:CHAT domain-containing protein